MDRAGRREAGELPKALREQGLDLAALVPADGGSHHGKQTAYAKKVKQSVGNRNAERTRHFLAWLQLLVFPYRKQQEGAQTGYAKQQ